MRGTGVGDAAGEGVVVVGIAGGGMALTGVLALVRDCVAAAGVEAVEDDGAGEHEADDAVGEAGFGSGGGGGGGE